MDTEALIEGLDWKEEPLYMTAACSDRADVRVPLVPKIIDALRAGTIDTKSFLARHALAYLPYYMYEHWGGETFEEARGAPEDLMYAYLSDRMELKTTRRLDDLREEMPCIAVMKIGERVVVSTRGTTTTHDWLRNMSTSPLFANRFIRRGMQAAHVDARVMRLTRRMLVNFVRTLKGTAWVTKYHYGFVHNGVYAYEVAKRYVAMLRSRGERVQEIGFYGTSLGGATAMIAGHLMYSDESRRPMDPELAQSVRVHGSALYAHLSMGAPQSGGYSIDEFDIESVGSATDSDLAMFEALAPAGTRASDAMRLYLRDASSTYATGGGARINVGVFAPANYASGYSDISFDARQMRKQGDAFSMAISMNYRDTLIHARIVNATGFSYPFKYDIQSLEACDRRGLVSVSDLDPCRTIFPKGPVEGEKRMFSHDVVLTKEGDRVGYWMGSKEEHYMMEYIAEIEASKDAGCTQRWFEAGSVYPGETEPECRQLWRAIDDLCDHYRVPLQ
jgi:Lipase (class 3)